MSKLPERTGAGLRSGMPSRPRLRALDSVLVADRLAWASRNGIDQAAREDVTLLWLAGHRALEWMCDGKRLTCPAGGGLLLDPAGGADRVTGDADGIVLILPRQPAALTASARGHVLPPSIALRALRSLASAWLASDARLNGGQARLAGRAVGELVAAALLPVSARGLRERRKTSLLDHVIGHIAVRYAEALDAPALCRALNCSRSALYRATRPMGGVVALLKERRLAVGYERLCDPRECAGVGEIARAIGFDDVTQFSRSFRLRYGTTASAVRNGHRHAANAGAERC